MGYYDFGSFGSMNLFKMHISVQDVAKWAERTRKHRKQRIYKHSRRK